MEGVFSHLLRHEAKITADMEAIPSEVTEVAIEAVVLVSLSYCQYLALVVVGFLVF